MAMSALTATWTGWTGPLATTAALPQRPQRLQLPASPMGWQRAAGGLRGLPLGAATSSTGASGLGCRGLLGLPCRPCRRPLRLPGRGWTGCWATPPLPWALPACCQAQLCAALGPSCREPVWLLAPAAAAASCSSCWLQLLPPGPPCSRACKELEGHRCASPGLPHSAGLQSEAQGRAGHCLHSCRAAACRRPPLRGPIH